MTITIPPSTASYTLSSSGTTASNAGTRGQSINGQPVGIYITGSNDTLVNTGTIIGGFNNTVSGLVAGVAVNTGTGDTVINQVGGLIQNTYSIAAGILFFATAGTVTNAGTIIGGVGASGSSGDGIVLGAGGSVTNLSTGTISGGGIYFGTKSIAGTVVNSGKILGDNVYGGVYMKLGGTITNLAGTIAANGASYGIKIIGGAGTVTNAATITGGSAGGNAIILSAVAGNRVIDQAGGVFIGAVNGGSNATMELGSSASAGTLTATGGQFTNFSVLTLDAGSRWTIKGDGGLSSEFSRIGGFTFGDTIALSGLSQTPTTFSSSTAVISGTTTTSVIIKAGSTALETLTLLGSIASSSFSFVAGATSTLTEFVPVPSITGISPDTGTSPADGITDTGTLTVSGTAAAGATITLFNGATQLNPTTVASGGGTWSITLGTPLPAGNGTLTATATLNGAASSPSAGFAVVVDATAPTITSNGPAGGSPNHASSDQFTVVFSETVFGVGTSSFSLTDTGTAGGSITSVSGSGTTYSVTVSSVTGDGTLRLDLKAAGSNGIQDTAGNQPAAYTSGATYTVEHTPPSVSSITTVGSSPNNASSEQFTVTFADFLGAVSGVSTASFVLATTGTANGSIATVSGSGNSYTVTVNGVTGDGTLGLNLKSSGTGISDAAGNAPTTGFVGQTYTVEHTPPSVSSINTVGSNPNNGGTEQFAVAFSEAVTGVTADDFALTDTGSVTGTITSISGSGSSYTVTVTGATGTGTMRLDLNSSGTGIADAAGNAISGGFTGGATFAISPASGTPSISAPSAATVGVGQNNQIGSVTISETPTSGGETFTLTVSDANGTLSANTGATNGGGTITPSNGNRTLTITGTLSQVNADLTTLTEDEPTTAPDTISYTLSDSNGGSASPASTALTVNGVPTISAPASASVAQNTATAIGTIGISETGNTTTSGETFSVIVSDGAGLLSANTGATNGGGTITPSNGKKTLTITGTLLQVSADLTTLTDDDASIAADTITVHVSDSFGNSDVADASIPVTVLSFPELTQPTIALTVAQGASLGNLWSALIANGVDPNPASLSIVSVGTTGTQGLVTLSTGIDSLTYLATGLDPANPVDVFTYTLQDGSGGTVTGTVDMTVTGPSLPTTVATTPGSTTTASGSGQRLISEGSGQTLVGSPAGGGELFGGTDTAITALGSGNTIDVEPGNHTIAMGANHNTLTLNDGNNTVIATGTGNTVTGGTGNNSISGMTGNATITLGNGNDTVTVSGANNTITVGTGTDKVAAGNGGNETVVAGDGTNTITGGGPNDSFTTGNGVSKITATGTNATITAGNGGDTITATGAGDNITTGSGNDSITVTAGSAIIKAGLGFNTIRFAGSSNDIVNQGGTDTLNDTGTNNTIVLPRAGQGLDTINGSVLSNGDTFDLRSALAATTWDQQSSDIGNYLTLGTSGSNALVQISATNSGTPITVAVLNGAGSASLSSFLTHAQLT